MYVCASCASVCGGARGAGGVHVLAGPLRHTSRFDSLHMCGVHRWTRSGSLLCGAPRVRQSSLSCRAHWSRAGGAFHIDIRISQPHTHGATAAHTHTPPARRRPGARSGPGSGTGSHTATPTRRDIEHTKAQPKRHSHSYTTRTVRSAGRRARARAFSISGETRREAGGDRRLGACCRASDQRVEKM